MSRSSVRLSDAGALDVPALAHETASAAKGTNRRPVSAAVAAREERANSRQPVRSFFSAVMPAPDPSGRGIAAHPLAGTMVGEPVAFHEASRSAGVGVRALYPPASAVSTSCVVSEPTPTRSEESGVNDGSATAGPASARTAVAASAATETAALRVRIDLVPSEDGTSFARGVDARSLSIGCRLGSRRQRDQNQFRVPPGRAPEGTLSPGGEELRAGPAPGRCRPRYRLVTAGVAPASLPGCASAVRR